MTVVVDEVERRIERMTRALREEGLRLTRQRLEVVREVAQTDEHPTAESVCRGVRARVPRISLDTVYRTLATLADLGLLSRVVVPGAPSRYDANRSPHHHFVCTRCGLIRDVVDPRLDGLGAGVGTVAFGSVESIEVQLRGACVDCARRERQHE